MSHPTINTVTSQIRFAGDQAAEFVNEFPKLALRIAALDDAQLLALIGEEAEIIPAMRQLALKAGEMAHMVETFRKHLAMRHARSRGIVG